MAVTDVCMSLTLFLSVMSFFYEEKQAPLPCAHTEVLGSWHPCFVLHISEITSNTSEVVG